jgi:hypothetical protein
VDPILVILVNHPFLGDFVGSLSPSYTASIPATSCKGRHGAKVIKGLLVPLVPFARTALLAYAGLVFGFSEVQSEKKAKAKMELIGFENDMGMDQYLLIPFLVG